MSPALKSRYKEIHHLFLEYQAAISNISNDKANRKPANDKWSINEIIYHISHAELAIVNYVQKKATAPKESPQAGFKSWYRTLLLRLALKSSRKFKAPKVLDEPNGPYDKETLINEWRIIRNNFESVLNSIPDEDIYRQLFKHPVVGKINIHQTLGFMADHMRRHLEQVKKMKREVNTTS